jgi:hypothetical protein
MGLNHERSERPARVLGWNQLNRRYQRKQRRDAPFILCSLCSLLFELSVRWMTRIKIEMSQE